MSVAIGDPHARNSVSQQQHRENTPLLEKTRTEFFTDGCLTPALACEITV